METDIGKKLDIYCDNIIHFLVFTAIGCGIYLKTGEVMAPPAFEDLETYKLKIEGTSISVKNPET